MTSDAELLERWRASDNAAGSELLRRHFKSLYRFFNNKISGNADDLIQATMLRLVRGRDAFRGDASFRSFLFVVARNELLRHLRSLSRDRLVLDGEAVSAFELSGSPSSAVARKAEHRLLLRALRHIPLDFQIALELHYWEDLSTKELAEILDIPVGTVKSRLRRARERLAEQIHRLDPTGETTGAAPDFAQWAAGVRDELGKE